MPLGRKKKSRWENRKCQSSWYWKMVVALLGILVYIHFHNIMSTISIYDDVTNNNNKKNNIHGTGTIIRYPPPRLVMGIMSHNLVRMERDRRQALRDSYLSWYKANNDSTTSSFATTPNRICTLQELPDTAACQLAYVFVLGAPTQQLTMMTTNQTELLDRSSSKDMILMPSNDDTEFYTYQDMLYLNIVENGEFGKTPTWFRYATLFLEEHDLDTVDYIAKTDSDTLLYPNRFFRWLSHKEETFLMATTTTSSSSSSHRFFFRSLMERINPLWQSIR